MGVLSKPTGTRKADLGLDASVDFSCIFFCFCAARQDSLTDADCLGKVFWCMGHAPADRVFSSPSSNHYYMHCYRYLVAQNSGLHLPNRKSNLKEDCRHAQ